MSLVNINSLLKTKCLYRFQKNQVCCTIVNEYIKYITSISNELKNSHENKLLLRNILLRLICNGNNYHYGTNTKNCYELDNIKDFIYNIVISTDDLSDLSFILCCNNETINNEFLKRNKVNATITILHDDLDYIPPPPVKYAHIVNNIPNDKFIVNMELLEKLSEISPEKVISLSNEYKCELSQKCLHNAMENDKICSVMPVDTFKQFILHGCTITDKCVKKAIQCKNTDLILYLFNNIKNYNEYVNQIVCSYDAKFTNKIIKYIVDKGYIVTYNDIINAATYKICLDVKVDHIKFDDNFYEVCKKHKFIHSYNIPLTMADLENACSIRDITKIRQTIKKSKLIPNEQCMINACYHKANKSIINYLVSCGGIITQNCIERIINTNNPGLLPFFKYFLEHNKIKPINKQVVKQPEEQPEEQKR